MSNDRPEMAKVAELAELATDADLAVAAAARIALIDLARDDSRSISAAAVAALGRTALRLRPDRLDFGPVPPDAPPLVADVLVAGPPIAVASMTVGASGPGLRATLTGRLLRVTWTPVTDWLDGTVTVRGPAGWAEVRVTGQVAPGLPAEADMHFLAGYEHGDAARMTVLPAPAPAKERRRGRIGLPIAAAVVVLAGGGVAAAVASDRPDSAPVAIRTSAPAAVRTSAPAEITAAPAPVARTPLALRTEVRSLAEPEVIDTIEVGDEPEGVTVSPDGSTLYVANQNSRILSVVDARTHRVTPVKLRNTPRFVTTSGDGRLVFVSMYETDKSGSGVAVVDAARRKVLRYLATGVQPYTLAFGPDDRLWVPIHSRARLEVYTADGRRPDARITVPANPHAVAFSGRFGRAYVASHESNSVSAVDLESGKLIRTVPVSRSPHSVAVSPDGRRVLVAGYDADTADLIDARTMRRTGPLKVGRQPQCVLFATDSAHAYVVNEGDDTLSVLDGATGRVTATVRVGRSPRTAAISPDGRLAYVTNGDDDTVSVLRAGA